jgi:hypothetical protein
VSLTARKIAGLESKLASLDTEFAHWRTEAGPSGPLEKHHTQVEAMTRELTVPVELLRARIGGLDADGLLAAGPQIEGMILDLHRIWDLFRSTLALRYVAHFAGYLLAADELAYRCYQRAEAMGAAREPPLLYFGAERSPVTRPRGVDMSVGGDGTDALPEAVHRLPMPLIGLPWFQVSHLPDAPAIAHEVGHDVEFDLGLSDTIAALIELALLHAGVKDELLRGWLAWRAEVFADVFGTLALGPSYTATLIDFLAADPLAVASEYQGHPFWSDHPPAGVRVLLSTATLELMPSFAPEAAKLREAWFSVYPAHAVQEFADDAGTVAEAVVRGPYEKLNGGPLTGMIAFSPEMHDRAQLDAMNAAKGARALEPLARDAREHVAAARIAFERDPVGYRDAGVQARVLRSIREQQTVGTRAGTSTNVPAAVRHERAAEAGRWLTDHLARANATPADVH